VIENCEQGILSGYEIWQELQSGAIEVVPEPPEEHLNPASLDLTLGPKVAVYRKAVYFSVGGQAWMPDEQGIHRNANGDALDYSRACLSDMMWPHPPGILSCKEKNEVITFDMPQQGWLLRPGIGYLMHTAERIHTKKFVPVLDGKSSLGRLFMTAHVTAGYGDPGFNGQYTLEVVVTHQLVVYPGMRFCQIRFHTLVGRSPGHTTYERKGHYVGAAAEGPVPSMAWKQFEEQSNASK
jgi:dCTP deaminase